MTDQTHFAAFRSLFKRDFKADPTSVPHIRSFSQMWAARFPAGGIDPMRAQTRSSAAERVDKSEVTPGCRK